MFVWRFFCCVSVLFFVICVFVFFTGWAAGSGSKSLFYDKWLKKSQDACRKEGQFQLDYLECYIYIYHE